MSALFGLLRSARARNFQLAVLSILIFKFSAHFVMLSLQDGCLSQKSWNSLPSLKCLEEFLGLLVPPQHIMIRRVDATPS